MGGRFAIVAARVRGKINMTGRRLLLIATLFVATRIGNAALPEQTVWSGLIIASNTPATEPAPTEITEIEGTLRRLFGYSQFQLIGQAKKKLRTGEEDWLAVSKYFSLQVDSRGEKADAYVLNLKLFQEQKLLLETRAKLSKANPLIIRGPQVGDGQLVIVLVVQ